MPSNPQAVQLTNAINQLIDYIAPFPADPTAAFVVAGGKSLFQFRTITFAGNANMIQMTGGPIDGTNVLGHLAVNQAGTLYLIVAGFIDGKRSSKPPISGTRGRISPAISLMCRSIGSPRIL